MIDVINRDLDKKLHVDAGTYIVLAAVFWGFNSFLVVADYFGWPKWMAKYKIQPTQNVPVRKHIFVFKVT